MSGLSVYGYPKRALTQRFAMHKLPETGYLRLSQIIGNPKAQIPPILPVSKSTWWAGVKSGRFPKPVNLGSRITAWRVSDIRALITLLDAQG